MLVSSTWWTAGRGDHAGVPTDIGYCPRFLLLHLPSLSPTSGKNLRVGGPVTAEHKVVTCKVCTGPGPVFSVLNSPEVPQSASCGWSALRSSANGNSRSGGTGSLPYGWGEEEDGWREGWGENKGWMCTCA